MNRSKPEFLERAATAFFDTASRGDSRGRERSLGTLEPRIFNYTGRFWRDRCEGLVEREDFQQIVLLRLVKLSTDPPVAGRSSYARLLTLVRTIADNLRKDLVRAKNSRPTRVSMTERGELPESPSSDEACRTIGRVPDYRDIENQRHCHQRIDKVLQRLDRRYPLGARLLRTAAENPGIDRRDLARLLDTSINNLAKINQRTREHLASMGVIAHPDADKD